MGSDAAEKIAISLDNLATKIESHDNDTKFSEHWSWQSTTLSSSDLIYTARKIGEKIRSVDWKRADEDAQSVLDDLVGKVESAVDNNGPNLFAGYAAPEALFTLLHSVDFQIESICDPSQVKQSLVIPASVLRSVNSANQRLEEAAAGIEGIENKITTINRAYDSAEKLPVTLEELAATLKEIEQAKQAAGRYEISSKKSSEDSASSVDSLRRVGEEAEAILDKVKATYRAATSEGLAHEFTLRSDNLRKSMLIWVLVLIAALFASGLIAHERVPEIIASVEGSGDWRGLVVKLLLGVTLIAAPVWMGWVATKQIGQRFRLSEDYAYKAALSAAYEGYRSEAVNLDPLFEARLFSIALSRLDEIPLRLIEKDVHGSPMHELLNSVEFKGAVEAMPALKDRVLRILGGKPSVPTQAASLPNEPSP